MTPFFCAGCSVLPLFLNGEAPRELRLFNWSDYLDPSVIEEFEKAHHCTVLISTFESNEEMLERVNAGERFDVIFPSSYQAAEMRAAGLLLDLEHELIPNVFEVDPSFLVLTAIDGEMDYSVPYMSGTTGFAYDAGSLKDLPHSWRVFGMPELREKGTLLDDMRETLGAALKCLGYSLNSTNESEIKAAMELVKKWKLNVASFSNEEYKDGIASGALLLAHGYSGDVAQVLEGGTDAGLVFVLPEEGFSVWCDDMVIPCAAQEVALAHAFINFMLQPDVASRNMQFCYYEAPNPAAYQLLPKSLRDDPALFVPMDLLFMGEMIRPLGAATALYERAWESIHSE